MIFLAASITFLQLIRLCMASAPKPIHRPAPENPHLQNNFIEIRKTPLKYAPSQYSAIKHQHHPKPAKIKRAEQLSKPKNYRPSTTSAPKHQHQPKPAKIKHAEQFSMPQDYRTSTTSALKHQNYSGPINIQPTIQAPKNEQHMPAYKERLFLKLK